MENILFELLISGGVAWFVGKLAFKQAVRDIIVRETEKTFTRVNVRIDDVNKKLDEEVDSIKSHCQKDYVPIHYCNMQHNNVQQLIQTINDKLDILLERGMK